MEPGTRVVAKREATVHHLIRGRMGTVRGQGVCSSLLVLFDGDERPMNVDASALTTIPSPQEEAAERRK